MQAIRPKPMQTKIVKKFILIINLGHLLGRFALDFSLSQDFFTLMNGRDTHKWKTRFVEQNHSLFSYILSPII